MTTDTDVTALVEAYGVLDQPASPALTSLLRIAHRLWGGSGAAVLIDEGDTLRPVAEVGVEGTVRAEVELVSPDDVTFGSLVLYGDEPAPDRDDDLLPELADRIVEVLELERTSRELFELTEAAAAADLRLNEFAGQMSHDINNPLAAVAMSLELAQDQLTEDSPPIVVAMIDRAARGADRMKRMIDGLQGFGRLGTTPLPGMVDLKEIVSEACTELADDYESLDVRTGELPTVSGDSTQLRALLRNLIDNAAKFARDEVPVAITISAVSDIGASGAEGWRVEIADNGRGVAPADQQRVFEPMLRLDRRIPGLGLGLATCRRIVTAHGGEMGVRSNTESPEGGLVAWFFLPN